MCSGSPNRVALGLYLVQDKILRSLPIPPLSSRGDAPVRMTRIIKNNKNPSLCDRCWEKGRTYNVHAENTLNHVPLYCVLQSKEQYWWYWYLQYGTVPYPSVLYCLFFGGL